MPQYIPSDPLFAQQWNLLNTGQSGGTAGIDINVTSVWPDYTGAGVVVAIYDNGVQYDHPDLNDNYDATRHVIINGSPSDAYWSPDPLPNEPSPQFPAHGTMIAGLVGAENDGVGSVGVAFGATLVGVLAPGAGASTPTSELQQAMQQAKNFDITVNSWNPALFRDGFGNAAWGAGVDGGYYDGLIDAVTLGRGGLGTVIVRAAGNTGPSGFDVQGYDGNSRQMNGLRQVIAVGGVTDEGEVTAFAARGANILVSAPTGSAGTGSGDSHNVWTTDISGDHTPDDFGPGDYYRTSGTSSATPQVAGVIALMLEANPDLGWRDVQQVLSASARHVGGAIGGAPLAVETDSWEFNGATNWNGGGLHYSIDYGFGLVDALAAVRMAETWHVGSATPQTSANEAIRSVSVNSGNLAIPDNTGASVTLSFNVTENIKIENVRLALGISHTRINDLHIRLISPDGTTSLIFNPIVMQAGNQGTPSGWAFGSHEFRGELSAGTWQAVITDLRGGNTGTLGTSQLIFSGSTDLTSNRYIYSNEFSNYAALPGRNTLTDGDGGIDTINASAVTAGSTINLNAGAVSTIDGQALTIAVGTTIENAIGGDGADTFTGNELGNIISGGRGADVIFAGAGADTLNGGEGDDYLQGNALDSDIFSSAQDTFDGGSGDDTLQGVKAGDVINGGAGRDFLHLVNDNAITINLGATGIEWITTLFGNDVIDGSTQTVGIEVYSDGGNDTITGSAFNDIIWSGSGNNTVTGGDGADVLVGDVGSDSLSGGIGNDTLYVDPGDSLINGGAGLDNAYITSGGGITLNLATTQLEWIADFVGGNDTLNGSGVSANLEVYAAGGTDVVTGGSGADFLWGGSGNDTLTGNGNNDVLVGQDGSDTLTGGAGTDVLYGSTGGGADGAIDTYVFGDGWGTDFVFDFEDNVDKIDMTAVSGLNDFSQLTLTNTVDGHCYVTFGSDLIAVANMAGQITQSDFLL